MLYQNWEHEQNLNTTQSNQFKFSILERSIEFDLIIHSNALTELLTNVKSDQTIVRHGRKIDAAHRRRFFRTVLMVYANIRICIQ